MAKRNKINLMDFAKSCIVSVPTIGVAHHLAVGKGDTQYMAWRYGQGDSFADNEEFEKFVVGKVCGWKEYYNCPEFQLLETFFKAGHSFEKLASFYDHLDGIKKHSHGRGAQLIYTYCRNVLKGRLSAELEKKYLRDLWGSYRGDSAIYKYAKYVIRGRLDSEFEIGCNNLNYINFLSSKGIDIEGVLMGNVNLSYNFYRVNWYLPEPVHNFMIASHLGGERVATIYFKQRKKDDRMIRNRLRVMDQSKTVAEIVDSLK